MAHLQHSAATLRISGDALIPGEVTALLGGQPTLAHGKGDLIITPSGGQRVARFGQWHVEATETRPEDLDRQVRDILGTLTNDLSIWRALSDRFAIDMFCGWFMGESNEGVNVAASTLRALGERGIVLALDIYAPASDDDI